LPGFFILIYYLTLSILAVILPSTRDIPAEKQR